MRALVLIAALLLSGCGLSPQGDMARAALAERGATAADGALENAVWYMCYAAPVGSLRRSLGGNPVKLAAWNSLCMDTATFTIPPP